MRNSVLNILILSHRLYPDIGGIETISDFLAKSFRGIGHNIHLLTWSKDPNSHSLPYKVIRNPSISRILKEHIWADVVFENNLCLRLAWPNLIIRRHHIIGLQTWVTRENGKIAWQDWIKLKWLNRAKKVIACSEAVQKQCFRNALIIDNTYQVDVFRVIPEIQRNRDFVFVGRLVSDKGVDLAIRAFHRIIYTQNNKHDTSQIRLTIIGDGPERTSLQNLVVELSLEKHVLFTGVLRGEELVRCLNQHKFILIPSRWEEPFGIVALEGMACGCIPIASDGGGLKSAIGKAGILFQRNNLEDLVSCMKKATEDNHLIKRFHEEIPHHLAKFHPHEISRRYLEVVESVLID